MKIYTEIIYSWNEERGELVQESSKSYDYDGPLTLCNDTTTPIGQSSAQTRPQPMQYPSNLTSFAADNWIHFQGYNFKNPSRLTLDIAMYLPGGALGTGYKSEYESVGLGQAGAFGGEIVSALRKDSGMDLAKLTKIVTGTTASLASEGLTPTLLKGAERLEALQAGTKTIMERAEGAVLNPFLVAAYKGPSDMRTHDFDFQMLPQDEAESKTCMKIVKAFKKAMLPSHAGGDSPTAPSMLFGYPDTFKITFFIDGRTTKGPDPMFNIGKSVLTGCDLNYDTENVPLFFDGTQNPVSINMKLSFMETEVMHRGKVDQGM